MCENFWMIFRMFLMSKIGSGVFKTMEIEKYWIEENSSEQMRDIPSPTCLLADRTG